MPALEKPRCFRDRPCLVDVDPDLALRSDRVAQRFQHLLLAPLVDADLDVVGR